jgi:EAL domain-containing protein (putative c-di-GMP-specific phosphodiesterase class I)/FixJ family two-component response regulator/GGDEF domain-containing protein
MTDVRILLVDDEDNIRKSLQRQLIRHGFEVVQASSGPAALELLAQSADVEPVDLIISDFRMPYMTGAEFLQQVQRQYPKIPGIILSAYADHETLMASLNSGAAFRFHEKPWQETALLNDIAAGLSERQRRLEQAPALTSSMEPLWLAIDDTRSIVNYHPELLPMLACHEPLVSIAEAMPTLDDAGLQHLLSLPTSEQAPALYWQPMVGQCWQITVQNRLANHTVLLLTPHLIDAEQGYAHIQRLLPLRSWLSNIIVDHPVSQGAVVVLEMADMLFLKQRLGVQKQQLFLQQMADMLCKDVAEHIVIGFRGWSEFMLWLPDISDEAQLYAWMESWLAAFNGDIKLDNYSCRLHYHLGYSMAFEDGETVDELYVNAQTACKAYQSSRQPWYVRYRKNLVDVKRQQLDISNALGHAIAAKQLHLVYQPRLRLRDRAVIGAEVLLRWQHPELGNVSPQRFIGQAEHDGIMDSIGNWVLQQSLQQFAGWRRQHLKIERFAINIAPAQLLNAQFPHLVQQFLQLYDVPAAVIDLEIPQAFLLQDLQFSKAIIEKLVAIGVHVTVDKCDLSSRLIAALAILPVQAIKLSRLSLLMFNDDPATEGLLQTLARISQQQQIRIQAKGVESVTQLLMLEDLKCTDLQGFLFSAAVSDVEFIHMLTTQPFSQDEVW